MSDPNHQLVNTLPTEKDFVVNLLETRSGEPHKDTGILPAFFTLKWTKGVGNLGTLEAEVAKPTKILCSIERWKYLLKVYEKLIGSFSFRIKNKSNQEIATINEHEISEKASKHGEHYEKFKKIKSYLFGVSAINFKFAQIVLTFKSDHGIEVNLAIEKLKNSLSVSSRPERILNLLNFECMTLGLTNDGGTRLLLNPWSATAEIYLFWESWQERNSDPQVQISIESDSIMIDISPEQIKSVELILKEFSDLMPNLLATATTTKKKITKDIYDNDKDQYYKDDLRAGAFQFVDSTTNNVEELPLPYQVMFWNKNISAMAWRYPQPRALTKIRVFPVPFKITSGTENNIQILCNLEYWSDCHGCYQSYAQFYLSESEMFHLNLPSNDPKPAIACTWRVVLTNQNFNHDSQYTRTPVSARVLAGCIRVDSYFNKYLVPDLTIVMNIFSINISLYNYINKDEHLVMPDNLREYNCDMNFPENQQFLLFNIDNIRAYLSTWNFTSYMLDVTSTIKCLVLDYAFLTTQTLIEPFGSKLKLCLSNNVGLSFISKPIHFKFGPSIAHTLFVSTQIWNQNWSTREGEKELVLITPYIVCNNCNVNLRFGQAGYEEIFLPTRFCHLYSWRSQKCKQTIRVALEEKYWVWSDPFRIDKEGTEILKMRENTIIVTIKSLSSTQKQITFSGQLIVTNLLLEHFELKIVEAVAKDKDKVFKNAQSYMINGKSSPASMIINTKKKYFLRLRFFGLESAWSGDIPLARNTKSAQPWLVKGNVVTTVFLNKTCY